MIEKIKLSLKWYGSVKKKKPGDGALGSQMLYIQYMWMTAAHRAPYGWCMGAIFVQKRWSRASLFLRGNSSCLAALIQADGLYLNTYSKKEACVNNRKGSSMFFWTELPLQNWNKLIQSVTATIYICAGVKCVFKTFVIHFRHLPLELSINNNIHYCFPNLFINCLFYRMSAHIENKNAHHKFPEPMIEILKCLVTRHQHS